MPPISALSPRAAVPALSAADLRSAMGRFATGVTVITATGRDGRPVGTTVSAVTSLSLDPPLMLVCLDHRSQTLAAVREHGAFVINVLAAGHRHVSDAFARSANDAAWEGLEHAPGYTGSPVLAEAHVAIDCEVQEIAVGGDHQILIGRVVELHHGPGDDEPLLYYAGRYAALARP